jgi:hypothetical protein
MLTSPKRWKQLYIAYFLHTHASDTKLRTDECIYSEANAKRVNYLLGKGHQIGSHTWAHLDLATLSWDESESSLAFLSLVLLLIFCVCYQSMTRCGELNVSSFVGVLCIISGR